MGEIDVSELILTSDNSDQATLKFLSGEYARLVHTTVDLSERFDSVETTVAEIHNTLSQLCNQLGIHPIEAESYQQAPPVTYSSDPYIRDDHNRLPLDNSMSLMPEFDGSNASDWLSKVERFFSVGCYSDLTKLDLVAFSLEGDVLRWFNWEMTRREFRSWDEFRRRLLLRFGTAPAESPGNRRFAIKPTETVYAQVTAQQPVHKEESVTHLQVPVSKLEHSLQIHKESPNVCEHSQDVVGCDELCEHQIGTVSAYVTESEELSSQVVGLDDSHLEHIFDNGLQTEMKEVLKLTEPRVLENQNTDVLRMETSSFCQPFSAETLTSKPVGSVSSLSFAVGTAANWSSGLSQNRQVWEPGGVLADHVLEDNVEAGSKGLAYAGCVLLGMNCAGLGSGKEELLATGQQMQRTDLFSELTCSQNKKQMLGYKTRMFKYKSSLRITRSASRDMNQFVGFMKFQLKHKWRSKHLHTISALGFYLSSVFSTVPSATSGRLQGLLEQVLQKDDEAYPQILDKLQLNLKQGMDVHGASGLRLFLCQQKFSSIWHRWRRKDSDLEVQLKERALVQSSVSPELLDEAVWTPEVGCRELLVKWQDHDASENFWMFSKDFVQLYPSSKLEDKLVFEGGSIDTIKQSYYRKKKPWVETEGFSCKEALEGNRGFAVSLEV